MLPAWRLARNSLAGRRRRFALLAVGAMLATALVVAVSCALTSLNAGMSQRLASTLGRADILITEVGGGTFDDATLALLAARPEVELAVPRGRGSIGLKNQRTGQEATAVGKGVDLTLEPRLTTPAVGQGRWLERDGEIVLDGAIAEALGAAIGDRLSVLRWGDPIELTVVGVNEALSRRFMPRSEGQVALSTLRAITGEKNRLGEIHVVLRERDATRAKEIAEQWQATLPKDVLARPSTRVTSGIAAAMRANDFFFVIISVLSFIASALIITTGLTTGVLERQRELAIIRCIGGTRRHLVQAQLMIGALVGAAGAAGGLPIGAALAWLLSLIFPDRLPAGFHWDPARLAAAVGGAVLCGVAGALWPAVSASRVSPLSALSPRSRPPRRRGFIAVAVLAASLVGAQLALLIIPTDADTVVYGYAFAGLPMMFVGYFLLAVPVSWLVARTVGPGLAWALRLPRTLLVRSSASAPFRNGFTAGALMVGLAIMTSVWTNGSALLRDWLGAIDFPDAFVYKPGGLSPDTRARVDALPFVGSTCAISMYKVDQTAFGVTGLPNPPTNFIAFEPEPFFAMTKLAWTAGDPEYAKRRLREGGAVLVAKEFLVKRGGFGVGSTFTVEHKGQRHDFEIVGAVSSPGLDVVGGFFDIGRDYASQAIHSVFGSRDDLRRVFGSDITHMLQIRLRGDISDRDAMAELRKAMADAAVLAGSGREIKARVTDMGTGFMRIASLVAVGAMLLGCFGVLNVIVAGIDARRFEFGVVRAVGASSGVLARLVIAEVTLIALTACVVGTMLGLQGSMAALRIWELVGGIEVRLRPPLFPVVLGWAILLALTLGTAAPFALALAGRSPRSLLAATRG